MRPYGHEVSHRDKQVRKDESSATVGLCDAATPRDRHLGWQRGDAAGPGCTGGSPVMEHPLPGGAAGGHAAPAGLCRPPNYGGRVGWGRRETLVVPAAHKLKRGLKSIFFPILLIFCSKHVAGQTEEHTPRSSFSNISGPALSSTGVQNAIPFTENCPPVDSRVAGGRHTAVKNWS